MKKTYGAPKAEKMEFNYSEAVVASNNDKCKWGTYKTEGYYKCDEVYVDSNPLEGNA